jgi:hypothetical protein
MVILRRERLARSRQHALPGNAANFKERSEVAFSVNNLYLRGPGGFTEGVGFGGGCST